ncbi:MAG: hypothetical protein L0I76_33935 [Pseudonocardia sp.]|nr:hypothetical protein [Pseudonocardia sp.]
MTVEPIDDQTLARLVRHDQPPVVDAPLPEWARGTRQAFDQFANWRRLRAHQGWSLLKQVPRFLALLVVYSPRGLARVIGWAGRYLYDHDSASIRHQHAQNVETPEYVKAHQVRRANLKARWIVTASLALVVATPVLVYVAPTTLAALVGVLVAVLIVKAIPGKDMWENVPAVLAGGAIWWFLPAWLATIPAPPLWPFLVAGAVALLGLGWYGQPEETRLVQASSPLAGDQVRLTAPMVTGALCRMGNSKMRDPEQIFLVMDVARVGPGYQVDLELPDVPATWVIENRSALAAALRREIGCVWPSVGERHEAHLSLYIANQPMAKARQAPWSLLTKGQVNVFEPAPLFTDKQNRWVGVTLAYTGWVVGAVPRMGKSFLVREWLLVMGLDPRTKVYAFDLKGTGDLSPCAEFAHVHELGDEDDEIESQLVHLRAIRQEMRRRTKVIRGLPRTEAAENKVTDELANRRDLGLEPIAVAADECQIWFEHPDKEVRSEFVTICTDLVKRGPALGIMPLFATQKPDAKSIPTAIADNASARVAFKVNGQVSNDQILGTSMYQTGVRATQFAFEDKGVALFKGEGADVQMVRTVAGLDALTSEKVAKRARALRQAQGRLTGQAAGIVDEADEQVVFVEDVRAVFAASQALHLGDICSGLARRRPELYRHLDNGALATMLRDADVQVGTVYVPGRDRAEASNKGVKREWLPQLGSDAPGEERAALRVVKTDA